jgi:hypothetical protein
MDNVPLPEQPTGEQPLPPELEKDQGPDQAKPTPGSPAKHKRPFKQWLKALTKKQWLLIALIFLVVVGGGITVYEVWFHGTSKPVHLATKAAPMIPAVPKPVTVPSTLSGLPVAPSVNNNPVTAIMIENSPDARPQSGLSQASVVFEALAEGGVTRFVALYQDTAPSYIGPVRSARPYYLQWLQGFDASVAHVGGSPEALQDISTWNICNLDEFYNSSYYQRITSRVAPHNVYTSIAQLNALEQIKGCSTSTFTGFPRKADQPSKTPAVTTINFDISSSPYNVEYQYNATTNTYERSEGGATDMDIDQAGNQTQINPKVVIGMIVPWSQGVVDGLGAYYSVYATIGSGPVYIFQDGNVTIGQWTKASNTSQITFTNSAGATIGLDAGQTWLTALSSANKVSYTN